MALPLHVINRNPTLIFCDLEALRTADKAVRTHYEGNPSRHQRQQAKRFVEQLDVILPTLRKEDFYFLISQFVESKSFASAVGGFVWIHIINWAGKQSAQILGRTFRSLIASVTCSPRPTSKTDMRGVEYQAMLALSLAGLHGATMDGKPIYRKAPTQTISSLYLAALENEEVREVIMHMYLLFYLSGVTLVAEEEGEPQNPDYYYWKVGPRLAPSFNAILETLPELYSTEESQLHAKLAETVLDDLVALLTLLWKDIECNFHYDVNSGGIDHYQVKGHLGVTSAVDRYFLKEGCIFPEVRVIYERSFLEGTLYEMRELSLDELETIETLDDQLTQLRGYRDFGILNFVVDTIAYHRIVCKEVTRNERRRNRTRAERDQTNRIQERVRAHFRRLQPDWNPSEERIAAATERFGRLPAGFTFVSEFDRNRSLSTQNTNGQPTTPKEPSTPLFSVGIEDVLRWIA